MCVSNYFILIIVVICYFKFSQSIVERPQITENGIVETEAIIRDIFNKVFHNLKLIKIQNNSRLHDYITIHKYFTSLTLREYEMLNEIANLVRINNKNTNRTDFMGIINDLLEDDIPDEKHKTELIETDETVLTYVDSFLKVLKKLKEAYSVDKVYVHINANILNLLKNNVNTPIHSSSKNESSLYKSDESDILDNNEFWEPNGRRIFKGRRTKIKHFPFMATIQMFNTFHCAGSIIKSDLIITASSCLQLAWNNRLFRENPAFLSARVGSSFYNGGGEVIPVLEIYFHPGYNPKNLRNNVCVVRLSRHLNFRKRSKRIKKIDFDRQPNNLPVTTPGITILGWGAKGHSPIVGNPWKNILSFSVLDVYPLEDCQDVYSREYVTKKNFCGGFFSRGGGACNHDVGGPGIVAGKLMGVISFGSPVCGTPDAPTVFTKLGYYVDWIEEIMEMDVPVSKKRTTLKQFIDPFTSSTSYSTPKSTTFNIPALVAEKMTPVPISVIDNQLRIFDENVFKEFLLTMFNSKEVVEYQDMFQDFEVRNHSISQEYQKIDQEQVTERIQPVTEIEDVVEPRTKIIDASTEHERGYRENTFTTIGNMDDTDVNDVDKDIEKLIDDVDLKEIVKEEMMVTPMADKDVEADTTIKVKQYQQPKNESILTLLYLSDDNNEQGNDKMIPINKFNHESDDVDNDGLSIPVNEFEDLTRANENRENILPESELYGLLSEVIG